MDDVAVRIGVAKSTIQRYEKGQIQRVKLPVIESIATALNVNPDWIIGNTDDPTPRLPITISYHPPNYNISNQNIIRIAGRNGSYEERVLSDEQLSALKAIIDQMPDASDDL